MVRQLTHDGQANRSGLGVPLHVAGMAGVVASLTSCHLKHILYVDPPLLLLIIAAKKTYFLQN